MKVYLNYQEICVGSRVTLRDLLAGQSITNGNGITVAVNNMVVPQQEWTTTFLKDEEKVTVLLKRFSQ